MRLWLRFRSALRNLFRKPQVEEQLDEELRSYIEMVTEERIAAGMSAAEAHRSAIAEFGGVEQVKQTVRDNRAGTGTELLWQDVRYGFRQLRRNRGFTMTAVITMGLGIGATTSIFSAVYSLLLRPLPYHDANQIVSVSDTNSAPLIDPDFVAARTATRSFQQLAGFHTYSEDTLTGIGDPMRVTRAAVTSDFLPVLGVVPALGRNFYPDEDWSGSPNVLLLSDHLWRNKFGADPKIVGKAIKLDGTDFTVIGVVPRHFSFPSPYLEPDIYGSAVLERTTTLSPETQIWGIQPIARLRPGVTAAQAQAEMQAFIQARAKGYPPEIDSWVKSRRISVEPLQRHLTGDDRKPLYILLACVAAVLLISCANVTNLQLARAVSRKHETAVRGALGATRARLIRQFLVESLVLSSIAAMLGLAIAFVVTFLVRHSGSLDDSQIPSRVTQVLRLPFGKLSATIQIDGWVLAFIVGLAAATTLISGLVPAISGSRTDMRTALASAGARMSSGREQRFFRHSLLVIEIGVALVLLACAGLLVRSFMHVMSYDSGFDASNTLTGTTSLYAGVITLKGPSTAWSKERYLNFTDQLLLRLKALPGVKYAALGSALPLDSGGQAAILYEGVSNRPRGQFPISFVTEITPEYFPAVGTPILAGRAFNSADNETSPLVAIVNSAFAKRFFAGEALGKRFKTNDGLHGDQFDTLTIVGVVEDVRHDSLERDPEPEVFRPIPQGHSRFRLRLVLRTSGNPALLANAMRYAVTAVDSRQPVFDIETMDQRVSDLVGQRRLIMLLIVCFAMLAVVLSAVGVYGVFVYSVTQRAHEMGIRLALGSSRVGVLLLVVTQAARLIVLGGILGLGSALALSKLLASLLVGVTTHDPISFSLSWILMTTVALLASAIPASQASRTNPIAVLHSD
jgi:putative ABC transport system permease protein